MSLGSLFRRWFLLPLLAAGASTAQAAPAIGFQHLNMPGGIEIGIWYPADPAAAASAPPRLGPEPVIDGAPVAGRDHPLVVISHGTGGSYAGHADTAIALARAGFVVAALTHPGDNWRDQSRVLHVEERPAALSALITYMLGGWRDRRAIDRRRVGAFGFSAGGFTVLVAAGGRPDLSRVATHCLAHPDFFDCRLVAAHGGSLPRRSAPRWRADGRLKAIAVAAPALGFAFGREGLARLRIPVQLWAGGEDRILPAPFYAEAVRAALPHRPEYRLEPGAGHFDFLAPCTSALAAAVPEICTSAPGFDRAAFHARMNAEIVRFFGERLGRSSRPGAASGRSAPPRRDRTG
jgi:predicted dienelactone hydrolase